MNLYCRNAENMKNKQKSELPVEKMETDGNSGNKKKSRKRKKKLGNATTSPSLEETKFQPKIERQEKSLVNGYVIFRCIFFLFCGCNFVLLNVY